jgi:hypothetical protein
MSLPRAKHMPQDATRRGPCLAGPAMRAFEAFSLEAKEESMFVGHFGLGLAGKSLTPRVGLGTLFLSVQLADALWPLFLLTGIEHVRIAPRNMRLSNLDFWDYPLSHSLLALAAWGALFGAVFFLARRFLAGALIVGAGVVSHWALDAIVHRPDMPLWPGGPTIGLGMWNSVPGTLAIEGLLYAGGIALYLARTRSEDSIGSWALWALLVLLAVLWLAALFGPAPPNVRALAATGLVGWLVIPWADWIDRHRTVRSGFIQAWEEP